MIRLFRKIRHKLLSENNYGIYILYATGEIMLVVIGILLALQIDNWNDARKLDSTTREYLSNLKKDVVADTLEINKLMEWGDYWEKRIGEYYEYYYARQWSVNQLVDSCLSTGFILTSYIPINNTFNDMLSSGKTSLLSVDIRMQLTLLKKKQDLFVLISRDLTQDIKINIHELEKYWIMEKSNFFKNDIIMSRGVVDLMDADPIPYNDQKLLEGLVFQHNIFNWTYKYINRIRNSGKEIISQSDDLVNIINMELRQ